MSLDRTAQELRDRAASRSAARGPLHAIAHLLCDLAQLAGPFPSLLVEVSNELLRLDHRLADVLGPFWWDRLDEPCTESSEEAHRDV